MAEIERVRYRHDALIDAIIATPQAKQRELAMLFGYTESWLSQIMSSDSFKVRLEARRAEIIDPTLVRNIEERLEGVARQSLDIIADKLEATKSADLAVKVVEISTRALGYGARDRAQVNVQNNFVVALPTKSASAAEWQKEHSPRAIIDLDTVIVTPAEQAA